MRQSRPQGGKGRSEGAGESGDIHFGEDLPCISLQGTRTTSLCVDVSLRVPIELPWSGYRWDDLVRDRGLSYPSIRRHADSGLDNQLAFLEAALDWVASNTPRDRQTRYLEATVTAWHNADSSRVEVLRSHVREVAG